MNISSAGLDLIKEFEGFRKDAYLCPAGRWTIGFGHARDVCQGESISEDMAEDLLMEDMALAEACVLGNVHVALTQGQFDACVSFVFNLGCGKFRGSTFLRKINEGNFQEAAREILKWHYVGVQVSPGLVRRRKAEYDLFVADMKEPKVAYV
jgi:lysozyme